MNRNTDYVTANSDAPIRDTFPDGLATIASDPATGQIPPKLLVPAPMSERLTSWFRVVPKCEVRERTRPVDVVYRTPYTPTSPETLVTLRVQGIVGRVCLSPLGNYAPLS